MFQLFIKKLNIPILTVIIVAGILGWGIFLAQAANNGNTYGYAWSEKTGWIKFDGSDSLQDYGVTVSDTVLAGYAWSENAGWIHMASTSDACIQPGGGCSAGYAYNVNSTTTPCSVGSYCLAGFAWGEGAGWIKFAADSSDYGNTGVSDYGVFIDYNGKLNG